MRREHRGRSSPLGLRELSLFLPKPPIPILGIVVLLVRQKGADIDVPSSLLLIDRLGIMDDGDEPVSILPALNDTKWRRLISETRFHCRRNT